MIYGKEIAKKFHVRRGVVVSIKSCSGQFPAIFVPLLVLLPLGSEQLWDWGETSDS